MADEKTSGAGNGRSGGGGAVPPAACVLDGSLDEGAQIAALELAHEFPGYFPVVVIARREEAFEARLEHLVVELQGAQPYRMRRRASRQGTYMSYRLELHVRTAREALGCRARLAELPGIVMLL